MTSDSYTRRVHHVMDHVRRNLAGDLSLETLARQAHFSPFHFHRIFKVVAGETVAQYTRRCRLERAAYLMMAAPSRMLGSIALEVGFSSQSDLSRSFRREYGLPPSTWDRKTALHGQPIPQPLPGVEISADAPPQAVVRRHPACRLAYVRVREPFVTDALQQGYQVLVEWLEQRGVAWRDLQVLGLSWDNYETTPLHKVRFDIGFVVSSPLQPDGEVGIQSLPAVEAVDVHVDGSLPLIAQAWDYLYEQWLPRSRYEPDDMPGIKRFRVRPDVLQWSRWNVDCSIAIRPLRP
ncbi:MAG: AraC family transcriptional regulator [Deltaproteobacteria bacterium]|nr:AraC family transcriptional regulator [Deltaproteobacteria bacterium]